MIRRYCPIMACLIGMTLMAGCGAYKPKALQDAGESRPGDFIESQLAMAAEDIQASLKQLVNVELGTARRPPAYQPLTPPTSGVLAATAVVTYDCSLRKALADVVTKIGNGWTLRETGRPPIQEVIVHASSDGTKSWFQLLEDMGWQADARADVHVSERDKMILLAWQGMLEPQAQVANHQAPTFSASAAGRTAPRTDGTVTMLYGVRKLLPAGWRYKTDPAVRELPVSLRDNNRDWRGSLHAMASQAGVDILIDEDSRRVTLKLR